MFKMNSQGENVENFPDQEEQIVIESCRDFFPVISKDENGNSKFTSFGFVKKEVVSKLGWDEGKVMEAASRDIAEGKISPNLLNPKGDQWEDIIGKTPRWDDVEVK